MERIAYSVDEVAELTNTNPKTVRKGMLEGKVPFTTMGRRQLIPAWYVEKMRQGPEAFDGPRAA